MKHMKHVICGDGDELPVSLGELLVLHAQNVTAAFDLRKKRWYTTWLWWGSSFGRVEYTCPFGPSGTVCCSDPYQAMAPIRRQRQN